MHESSPIQTLKFTLIIAYHSNLRLNYATFFNLLPSSYVFVSCAGIQSSSDTPSIHTLLHYDTGDGHINIPQHIGVKYQEFGIMLLDTDYSYIEVLERQYLRDAVQINSRILQDWLNGKGKHPKTWATLIEVLVSIELSTLANIIKKKMDKVTL